MAKLHGSDSATKAQCILEAAKALFLAHGFAAATTDMIQKAAGVSKATMYACFPTKEAIFEAVVERQCRVMAEAVGGIRTERGSIERALTDLGYAYLQILLSPDALGLLRVVVAEAPRFPHLARHFFVTGPKATMMMIAALLAEAAQAGEIDVQMIGVPTAASLFVSLLRGAALMECVTHPAERPSAEQMDQWVQAAVITFMRAYGA